MHGEIGAICEAYALSLCQSLLMRSHGYKWHMEQEGYLSEAAMPSSESLRVSVVGTGGSSQASPSRSERLTH